MSTLHIDVFVSGYKNIPPLIPGWPEDQQATWPASPVTLISGDKDAVLVDALVTHDEVAELVEWIKATGKNLTTIYITHGHADHFFGLNDLLAAFPAAAAVTLPQVIADAEEQTSPGTYGLYAAAFPGQIPETPIIPAALDTTTIDLEGHQLQLIDVGQGDTDPSTVVYVPELNAVIGGDVVYNGIHMWMMGTDHESRLKWLDALDTIENLEPTTIVAGHRDPAASDQDVAGMLAASRAYIRDYDEAVKNSAGPAELIGTMLEKHGNLGNPFTLWIGAGAQFAPAEA